METSNWGTPIELSSSAEAAQLRFREPADRSPVARSLYARRAATVLVLVGAVLVAASQVLPWLTVQGSLGDTSDLPTAVSDRQFSTADGVSVLLFAYDVLWLPVFVLCASCVFAQGSRQRMLFGAGAAALASQVAVLLPLLAKPGRVIGQGSLFDSGSLHANLSAGAYFAVAAVLLLAGALVLAVGGRVLPTADDEMPAAAPVPVRVPEAAPAPGYTPMPVDMHAALAASQPHREQPPDIDYGAPAQMTADPADGSGRAPVDHSMYDTRPRPATADHSMYARPRESEESRG
jgi:hypothetical protein